MSPLRLTSSRLQYGVNVFCLNRLHEELRRSIEAQMDIVQHGEGSGVEKEVMGNMQHQLQLLSQVMAFQVITNIMELKLSDFERLQMSCTKRFLSCKSCCLGTNLFQPQQAFAGLDNLSQSNILISLIPSCLASLYGEMSSSQLGRLVE